MRLNYGFAYTHQDRDANSALFYKNQAFAASPSYNAKLAQIFGEVAYTGLNLGTVNVEPYVGLAWMHLSADDFSNDYVGGKVSTKFDSQNLAVSNLGARVKVPFEVGPAKFKAVADVNWTQYMGDTRGKSTLKFGNGASATIKSEKLSAVAAVGDFSPWVVGASSNEAPSGRVRSIPSALCCITNLDPKLIGEIL